MLTAGRCAFEYRRLKPHMVEIRIDGTDSGQFGTCTLDWWTRFFALNQRTCAA